MGWGSHSQILKIKRKLKLQSLGMGSLSHVYVLVLGHVHDSLPLRVKGVHGASITSSQDQPHPL